MDKAKQYETNLDFLEFLNNEFNDVAANAIIEELAEFAFGDVDKAFEAFMRYKKNDSKFTN
jgi:hypothetical protein